MTFKFIDAGAGGRISETTLNQLQSYPGSRCSIWFLNAGQLSFRIGKRALTLFPGNFVFVSDESSFSIISSWKAQGFAIRLDPEFIKDFESRMAASGKIVMEDLESHRLEHNLFFEAIYPLQGALKSSLFQLKIDLEAAFGNQENLARCLDDCLLRFYSLYQKEVVEREQALHFLGRTTRHQIMKRLSLARDYMISNHNRTIRLEDIATAACLSVNHLMRTFKQAYQQTPHQFLTNFRLQQSRYYLDHTDYPVQEIVDIVGFGCTSSFIRLFRNSFETTPGQYRYSESSLNS